MLLKIILASSFFLLGATSCQQKPDAFRCILIMNDDQGNKRPIEEWYWYCLNARTNEVKEISINDSDKCIRDGGSCKWLGLDLREEDRIRKWYEKECSK